MKAKKSVVIVVVIVSIVLILVGLTLCSPTIVNIPLGGDDTVQMKPASLFRSILGATCSLRNLSGRELNAQIELQQTFWKWPVTVIPTTNNHVFLCLYYNDVDVQLLRFDTESRFRPLPSSRPISRIVLTSSCKVDEPDDADWKFALETLKRIPADVFKARSLPDVNLGVFSLYGGPQEYVGRMRAADEIMYPGDVVYPDTNKAGKWIKHP
jgi:hypothetical protein